MTAVVDLVVKLAPVAGAPAILRRDDDVTALHRLTHEREVILAPTAVDATVHPHHCGVATRAALRQRLEQIGRDLQIAHAALVLDLLKIHHTATPRAVDAVSACLRRDVALEVAR